MDARNRNLGRRLASGVSIGWLLWAGGVLTACDRRTTVNDLPACMDTTKDLECPDAGYDPLAVCLAKCPEACSADSACLPECKAACRGKFQNGPAACVAQCGKDCGQDQPCRSACFGACAGKPPPDVTSPHTRIDSGPPSLTADTSAPFMFSCNEADCVFVCRFDANVWFECTPGNFAPFGDGAHTFEVRAYDSALNFDPDPAVWHWNIDTFVAIEPPPPPVPLWPVVPTWQDKCYDDAQETACPLVGAEFHGQDAQYASGATGYVVYAATVTDGLTALTWQRTDDGVKRTWQVAANYCATLVLAGYDDWRLPGSNELLGIVDFSRASPAVDPLVFPNTKPSFYWAAQTGSVSSAWAVLFSHGYVFSFDKLTASPFVRCVR